MLRILLTLGLVALLATPAFAELSDDDYVNQYFGTTAAFAVDQPVSLESGWWGDMLPQKLTMDNVFVNATVNAIRSIKGVTPLLADSEYAMIYGQEGRNPADGKYYYTLDFVGVRPSELDALLKALGGAEKVFPGASLSLWPVVRRSFYSNTTEPGKPVSMPVGSETVTIDPSTSITAIRDKVGKALKSQYGTVEFDVYFNQYIFKDGTGGADLSSYAEVKSDLVPVLEYEQQGE